MAPRSKTTEKEMLAHARRVFSERGFRETSLEEIAQLLGVTRQAFYHYFKSKDELLMRIIGDLGAQLLARAQPIMKADVSPQERIRLLVTTHVDVVLDDPEAFRIYLAERHNLEKFRRRIADQGEYEYTDFYAAVIESGQKDRTIRPGPARVMALLLLGQANSVLRWYVPKGSLSTHDIANLVAEMAISSLCP